VPLTLHPDPRSRIRIFLMLQALVDYWPHLSMKRRTTQSMEELTSPKKLCKEPVNGERKDTCLIIRTLAQYGILESITSYLFPVDLDSLAATSRAAYKAIFPRKESRLNLLRKMNCDGTGIQIRKKCHKKSVYFERFGCTEVAECGTQTQDRCVESRSCISCGFTTCNECRIHCVYQSIFQTEDEDDELPNFSGFVLLSQPEMGILSPAHHGKGGPGAFWDLTSHHDIGILDSPLETDVFAAPESIDEIINTDLGIGPLKVTYASNLPHPSPVIQAFWDITEERKRLVCNSCFEKKSEQRNTLHPQCHCTLKKRFLDRWLCIKCYKAEENAQQNSDYGIWDRQACSFKCRCSQQISEASARLTCLWCWGEVATPAYTPISAYL